MNEHVFVCTHTKLYHNTLKTPPSTAIADTVHNEIAPLANRLAELVFEEVGVEEPLAADELEAAVPALRLALAFVLTLEEGTMSLAAIVGLAALTVLRAVAGAAGAETMLVG